MENKAQTKIMSGGPLLSFYTKHFGTNLPVFNLLINHILYMHVVKHVKDKIGPVITHILVARESCSMVNFFFY